MRAPTPTDTIAHVLFVSAAIAYSGVMWEALAGYPLDPARAYLSELAAENQPTSAVFRSLDALTGVLVLIAMSLHRSRWISAAADVTARWSAMLLGAFAALTVADSLVPLACAGSADAACAAADAAGTLGLAHQVHAVTSSSALAAATASAVLLALATGRRRGASPRARPASRVLRLCLRGGVIVFVGTTVGVSLLAVLSASSGTLPDGGGYLQRAQVVLLSVYIAAFPAVMSTLARRRV
ncbi:MULTISPECIES: DUF998 domain-containing protein [Microbacterium]|uniref:DUF998 domain-containing protein n=1 Tax=Microbacterium TaxID=33882 RepID=UPI0025A15774|nr:MULTISPECIES: DUF998 domain-containing protein [Microbacterium]MDF2560508.1 hypothetical protein [Microbacterium sp.]WJM16791.1 DUF998 domain-containing protein [Microbacterium arborescens]